MDEEKNIDCKKEQPRDFRRQKMYKIISFNDGGNETKEVKKPLGVFETIGARTNNAP